MISFLQRISVIEATHAVHLIGTMCSTQHVCNLNSGSVSLIQAPVASIQTVAARDSQKM